MMGPSIVWVELNVSGLKFRHICFTESLTGFVARTKRNCTSQRSGRVWECWEKKKCNNYWVLAGGMWVRLWRRTRKACGMPNVMQGKLHEDNEMAIMGLTSARRVLAVFIWSKKTQQSNTIIAGHMYSKTLWLQASVFFYIVQGPE